MRRRLALTVLAVTAMLTVAFLLPLAFVVRVVAADRSLSAADQESRSLAGVLAAVSDPKGVEEVVQQLKAGNGRSVSVILPTGQRIGSQLDAPATTLARSGRAFTASSNGETRVWVPVRLANGDISVGVVAVRNRLLRQGVLRAWTVLAAVGSLVLVLGVFLADRLARSTVVAIEDLGAVTRRLRQGNLDARVRPTGPAGGGHHPAVGAEGGCPGTRLPRRWSVRRALRWGRG